MRFPPDGFFIPRRGAAMKGIGTWKWVGENLYFQRATKPRPIPATEAERFNRSQLYWSTQVVKYMDSYQRQFALGLSQKTQLAAQDFLYIALFGRIGHMVRRDGKVVYSLAAIQDVSKLLDTLYQLKGGILVRDETWWKGLPPGEAAQVLTMLSDTEIGWQTPEPPATTQIFSQPIFTSATASTDAFATQGIIYSVQNAITITKLVAYMAPSSGQLYKAVCARCTLAAGVYTIAAVQDGPATTPNLSRADTWSELSLSAPFAVSAGDNLFIGVTRTNGTTTNAVPIGQATGFQQNAPIPGGVMKAVNLASTSPAVGNAFTNRADIVRCQGVFWSE